jgi:hypothetical protein
VFALVGDVEEEIEPLVRSTAAAVGYVYLAKSGRHYKIGQTNDLVRRTNELRIQLPERISLVHQISTDDPVGIERVLAPAVRPPASQRRMVLPRSG